MSIFNGDASEIYKLAADLSQVSAKAVAPVRASMLEAGNDLRDQWRENVQTSSPTHIPAFAGTIEARPTLGVSQIGVEVTPKGGGQARLGTILELGGSHSPPHLWGLRAQETVAPKAEKRIGDLVEKLFP